MSRADALSPATVSPFDPTRLNDQERGRLSKVEALRRQAIDPYPPRVARSHAIVDVRSLAPGPDGCRETLRIAGRLVARRNLGKMSFGVLDDGTASMQIMVRRERVDADWFRAVWRKLIDLGDFLAVQGELIVTRTGELTLDAQQVRLASKSLKPLPDKWHGLQNPERRYRQRHVDLAVNADIRRVFRTRAQIMQSLRAYLDGAGFLEVETPVLQPVYGGAAALPFVTHHNQLHQDLYLRISFELYLKRLIVGGFDKVYEIGRDFRNEGVSFKHNPEFTQMEFYEAYADYAQVMERLEALLVHILEEVCGSTTVTYQGRTVSFAPPWERKTLRAAIQDATGLDILALDSADALREAMRAQGVEADPSHHWGQLVDGLLSRFVEPKTQNPVFLMDYPRAISPFAKSKPGTDNLVERFELFVAGMELANAFTEINDPQDQYQRFLGEAFRSAQGDEEAQQMDYDFIEALAWGMPPTGGCGIGIDRLTMLLTDKNTIREVILFPHLRQTEDAPSA